MPKRIGFLYEAFTSYENCVVAERLMAKNKPDNKMAKHIGNHAEEYGLLLHKTLINDSWTPSKNREFDIVDNYKGKIRHLKVPCLADQAAQYAWLNIAIPYIEKRNYFYNCGSIPKAGQIRAIRALKRWLGGKKPYKYGAIADIRHFYDTLPHSIVMKGLTRIFKDKRFVNFAGKIMQSMSKTGVGIAIGHPSSHWFANVALMELDHYLCNEFKDVVFTRYMDDYAILSNNKRHLKKFLLSLMGEIEKRGMKIKKNYQIFPTKQRALAFLSYRFFRGYTLLSKPLMYRISHRIKSAAKGLTVHIAASVLSYLGILKHCNGYNYKLKRVYPYVKINECKELISNAAKNKLCCAT
jgi:retron-type reverse transcriptase